MTNKNFSEIFSYWGEKERALSQRPARFKRPAKVAPKPNPTQQPTATTTTTVVDEASKQQQPIKSEGEENKLVNEINSPTNAPTTTTTTTTTTNTNTTVANTEVENDQNKSENVVETTTTTTNSQTPIKSSYENEDESTPSKSGYENSNDEKSKSTTNQNEELTGRNNLTSSFSSTASRYDNAPLVSGDVENNNNNSYNAFSQYSEQGGNNNNNNNNNNSYSQYGGNMVAGGNYSQYGGSLVGGGSSNYNISSYGGSSSYSAYNANGNDEPYSEDEEDEDYEQSDLTTSSGNEKKKRAYSERDISESDLLLLESLVQSKSKIGEFEEDEDDKDDDDTCGTSSRPKLTLSGYEEENNFNSNPYISSNNAFISSYSHPKFLTDKALSESSGSGRTITQSSASSLSTKKMESISLYSWNSEFQRLLEMDDCLEKFERLSSLEHDFVYAAESYGRIIISENFLSNELKTIKPVSVGGIAGGEKYIVQGILFKFALESETFGLYGNDENAMKTAAHELNGCTSFLNCGVKGLHVPLMAFIDYRGFRLMAMSLLPISKKSLIYGSCDAGQTVHTSNNIFNNLFSNAAKIVNLKPHFVQDISGDIKSISGPIDIEGHLGSDNRFYLLDFARLSPPEPPKHRGSYLYKLLRLELVRKYQKPLCSDAFSPMSSIDIDMHNVEVQEAYDDLINNIIPKFSKFIQTRDEICFQTNSSVEILRQANNKIKDISKLLHAEGINVRYIGEVASHCTSIGYKRFFTIEAIVRTLKSLARELLRREMKKTHLPSDYPYRNLLLNFLNLIFDDYKGKTELFWSKIVFEKMEKKFQNIFVNKATHFEEKFINPFVDSYKDKESFSRFNSIPNDFVEDPQNFKYSPQELIKDLLLSPYTRSKILTKFCKSIGLVLSKVSLEQFSKSSSFVFVDPDIKAINTLVSRLNIIDYADGMSLYYKSMATGLNSKSKNRLLTISKDRLEESIHSMSTNHNAMFQLANVIRLLAKTTDNDNIKRELFTLAENTVSQLEQLRIDQNLLLISRIQRIKISLSHLRIQYFQAEKIEKIEQIIKDTIELSPNKAYPNYLLAKFYFICSKGSSAEYDYSKITDVYDTIFTIDPNYQKAHIGISIFLLKTQHLHKLFSPEKVSDHIVKAFKVGNIESIVNKIKPLVDFNPWVVFESSRSIPKVRSMVKSALELKVEKNNNKLLIPHDLHFEFNDQYYFENIKLEKIYFDDHSNAKNIEVFSKIQSNSQSIIIRFSKFSKIKEEEEEKEEEKEEEEENNQEEKEVKEEENNNNNENEFKIFESLSKFRNIIKLNLGFSKGVKDEMIENLITPILKKLKLYELPDITDKTVKLISSTCKELEVLDLGGCSGILGEDFNELYKGCPSIAKLALPPFIENDGVSEILNGTLPLVRLDLIKCSKVTHHSYSKALDICSTLKKVRNPIGVPMFYLDQQYITARHAKVAPNEPCLRYSVGGMELFYLKIGHGIMVSSGRNFELFYNNKNPLVRFRNPPNALLNSSGFFKVAHVNIIDKPITKLTVYNDITMNGNWRTIESTQTLPMSSSPTFATKIESQGISYQFKNIAQSGLQGITFTSNVSIGSNLNAVLTVSNAKTMRLSVDADIKTSKIISPFAIFFAIATGIQN
ncbi:hypothetical protein DDB_G0276089 [Dictyostelium discoideum AX4]|uniref:Clu domain-containing protein n=1 Tax=Dictyostelium discoideum TaxID=44689 RepID=Q75JJ3_DICDI|nr:hypothetical protein DDB_G0276089 [Dictyostelium discoideum AX4]EAL69344.1 hypothetical protein DDB_G0276089 [Dictyostelium discoideum AX4]|eukprot:XP_643283.1 hypothetical protein DDB_G0276089 [Dictyostelium discoideum AX4]